MEHVVVVIAGGPVARPERASYVVAVDGGLDAAYAIGLEPDVLVGDLDSVSSGGLARAEASGVPIERHPAAKDATDTELAFTHLIREGRLAGNHLTVLGGDDGTRLDHVLGTLLALGDARLAAAASITAVLGRTRIHVLHPPGKLRVPIEPGRTFSVLALHGGCDGVSIDGARWHLQDATLPATSALGLSNVAEDDEIRIAVEHGVLTLLVPEDVVAEAAR